MMDTWHACQSCIYYDNELMMLQQVSDNDAGRWVGGCWGPRMGRGVQGGGHGVRHERWIMDQGENDHAPCSLLPSVQNFSMFCGPRQGFFFSGQATFWQIFIISHCIICQSIIRASKFFWQISNTAIMYTPHASHYIAGGCLESANIQLFSHLWMVAAICHELSQRENEDPTNLLKVVQSHSR